MEIRSYRRVFDLERRIYRVDRLRLNPGGVPVRGVVYFLVILVGDPDRRGLPLVAIARESAALVSARPRAARRERGAC